MFDSFAGPGNEDYPWDKFDPVAYHDHNYGRLLREDAQIIKIVAEFFQRECPFRPRQRGIDVGPGANLYPAMTMLPFVDEITLYEHGLANRRWLKKQLGRPAGSWRDFWAEISDRRPVYDEVKEPFVDLERKADVWAGNILEVPPRRFDMGTMFFVAESMTSRMDEFQQAITNFFDSLITGAPFAAAFMRHSEGYRVGGHRFPACSIDEQDVRSRLSDMTAGTDVFVIPSHGLRDGYDGMILATGVRK